MMIINSILSRLQLPMLSAPAPQPAENRYRVLAIDFEPSSLELLQRVVDVEIQMRRFDFYDNKLFGGIHFLELMWIDSLLPTDGGMAIVNGLEFLHLTAYIDQRILRMRHYQKSMLGSVDYEVMVAAFLRLRERMLVATEIIPLTLPQTQCYLSSSTGKPL